MICPILVITIKQHREGDMNIRKEIDSFAPESERPILHWLLDHYSWRSQWGFVATCTFQKYGTQSYEVNRVWSSTIEGRVLYENMADA